MRCKNVDDQTPLSPNTPPIPTSPDVESTPQTKSPVQPQANKPVDKLETPTPKTQSLGSTQLSTQGLERPSVASTPVPSIQVTTVPDLSAADLDALNLPPAQDTTDPNKLSLPLDTRINDAKANLSKILEALGKHPQLEPQHNSLTTSLENLVQRHAQHLHQTEIHTVSGTKDSAVLDVEAARIKVRQKSLRVKLPCSTSNLKS